MEKSEAQAAGALQVIPTVEIPLDEYKAFIEYKVKGPTVEIPLEEYDRLREENRNLQNQIWGAEREIDRLQAEIGHRRELDEQTDITAKMVADDLDERIKGYVSDLVTKITENKEQEVKGNGRI